LYAGAVVFGNPNGLAGVCSAFRTFVLAACRKILEKHLLMFFCKAGMGNANACQARLMPETKT
jgi:hypothetical protein